MPCDKIWKRSAGVVWNATVADVDNVLSTTGRLLTTNRDDPDNSPPRREYDHDALVKGISITLKASHSYRLDAVVVGKQSDKAAKVHAQSAFDGNVAFDQDCECTAGDPLIEWQVIVP